MVQKWEIIKKKKYGLPHQPYSFFGSCVPESCHNGKILNDTFRVDSFASTGFSAIKNNNKMYIQQVKNGHRTGEENSKSTHYTAEKVKKKKQGG